MNIHHFYSYENNSNKDKDNLRVLLQQMVVSVMITSTIIILGPKECLEYADYTFQVYNLEHQMNL